MFIKFEKFLEIKQEVNQRVDELAKKLQSFPRENNGMLEEKVKNSREFKSIKSDFDFHFKRLREINTFGNTYFKKELKEFRENLKRIKPNDIEVIGNIYQNKDLIDS